MLKIKPATTYKEAQDIMFYEVPKTKRTIFMRAGSLERSKAFFELLGNPQNNHKTLHVAGTSGKGSIVHMIDSVLLAHGKTTCLHVSPHVYDVRERLTVNGKFVSEDDFVRYINMTIPSIETMSETDFNRPTFYELSTALGFLAADDHEVDYTVEETGLGGLYDSSNSVDREDKIAVVGRIGLDHVPILANPAELEGVAKRGLMPDLIEHLPTDIERITAQKAGIIPFNGQAIALRQDPAVDAVIQAVADYRKTKLIWINPHDVVEYESTEGPTTYVTLHINGETYAHVDFNLPGTHQLENLSLALAAIEVTAKRDGWELTEDSIRQGLKSVWLPGRFEIRHVAGKTIVLDGSHNPQKMQALVETFQRAYPNKTATLIMAMNKSKDVRSSLTLLEPIANKIICTDFFTEMQDFLHKAFRPAYLAKMVEESTTILAVAAESQKAALTEALDGPDDLILITGSFYFLGEINDILKAYES